MKGATQCARRIKQQLRSLRTKLGKVSRPPLGDPISHLILGVFSRDVPESKAREALDQMRSMVVDYNELRVIAPLEMADAIGDYPDIRLKCEDLSRALNRIFAIEHVVSLDRVAQLSAKDARAYLDRIDGLEPYTRARIRLLGFQHHGMPLDEAMFAYARQAELIDAKCTLDEAQAFMERQVSPEDAVEFFTLLRKHAWAEVGAAVRRGEVERIQSIPPDRTSRNMLQTIAPLALGESADEEPEFVLVDDDQPAEATSQRRGTMREGASPRRAGARKGSAKPAPKAAERPVRGNNDSVAKPRAKPAVAAAARKSTRKNSAKAKSA